MTMQNLPEIIAELDAEHAHAREAFGRKDLIAYMSVFSPTLRYRQPNGKVLDRERLMCDVEAQFHGYTVFRANSVRDHIELFDDNVIEALTQTASVWATMFFVVHRAWNLTRRGRYTWRKTEHGWQIEDVEVLEEALQPRQFHCGFRLPDPV
jgi:hypothetical protein